MTAYPDNDVYETLVARQYFMDLSETLKSIDSREIANTIREIKRVKRYHGTVWIAGNGGSAATASHFANDLVKVAGVKAVAVSDMTPTTLAYMNDDGAKLMFAYPVRVFREMHDLIFVISCSGDSENIVILANEAKGMADYADLPVILLTGHKKGEAHGYADIAINVPHQDIRIQEDAHLAICHNIVGLL